MIYRSAPSLVRIPRLSTYSRSFHPLSMSLSLLIRMNMHIFQSERRFLSIAHIVRWCQTMTVELGVHGLSHISFVGWFLGFRTGFTKWNRHHRLIVSRQQEGGTGWGRTLGLALRGGIDGA